MVRAADEPAARRLAYLGEHVPTVAAHVVEGPHVSSLVTYKKRGLVAERNSTPVPRTTQVLRTADAHPTLVEEMLHLPIEHRNVRVSLGGQAHLPLRDQRRSQQRAVNRRHEHSSLEPVRYTLLHSLATSVRTNSMPVALACRLQYNLF